MLPWVQSGQSSPLEYQPASVILRVGDNGDGFDEQETIQGNETHFGLLGMRERSELVGGKLTLRSEQGRGTTVELVVPRGGW